MCVYIYTYVLFMLYVLLNESKNKKVSGMLLGRRFELWSLELGAWSLELES